MLGYEHNVVDQAPDELLELFCGVGNPLKIGTNRSGVRLLDIGCGGGFDLFVASKTIAANGSITGVDISPEMLRKAKKNLQNLLSLSPELVLLDSEILPFEDNSFDIVISNGAINLSPKKRALFKEIYRVLAADGELRFADIILEKELPPELSSSIESWSE